LSLFRDNGRWQKINKNNWLIRFHWFNFFQLKKDQDE